jgi:hypothetical protein
MTRALKEEKKCSISTTHFQASFFDSLGPLYFRFLLSKFDAFALGHLRNWAIAAYAPSPPRWKGKWEGGRRRHLPFVDFAQPDNSQMKTPFLLRINVLYFVFTSFLTHYVLFYPLPEE